MKTLTVLLALAGSQVKAQQVCAPHNELTQHLAENYGESRQVIALNSDGVVIEFFAADSGTWTLTVTPPGGLSCLGMVGESFQLTDEPLPPLGEVN